MLKQDCSEVCQEEALGFVLDTQCVTSGGRTARVVCGSGMGEESSGAISDYSFFCRCEREFLLKPDVRAKYGIVAYVRYRDDLVIITNGTPHDVMRAFLEG